MIFAGYKQISGLILNSQCLVDMIQAKLLLFINADYAQQLAKPVTAVFANSNLCKDACKAVNLHVALKCWCACRFFFVSSW